MYSQSRKFVFAIAVVLFPAGSANAAEISPQSATDIRQETQIWTSYAINPHLRANDLTVLVHNGKATLSGKVDDGVSKELAKQIALGVSGIKEVDNLIEVQDDYVPPASSAARSYGQAVDDATITAAVKSKLLWSKYTSALKTEVETKSGQVTLQGTADSAAARDLAGRLAMNTPGVVSVLNKLTVSEAKPTMVERARSSAHEAGQVLSDSWITTKVKSTLLYTSRVDSSAITVTTRGGEVTLSGKLASGAERALAIELAKNVRGVKRVNAKPLTF